jgi:hypothetical protein
MTDSFDEHAIAVASSDASQDEPSASFAPAESWRASFEKQATVKSLEKLHRIARARLAAFSGGYGNVPESDVDDVVIAVLGDTWSGVLAWNPTVKPLYAHLKDAIKYRVRNGAKLIRRRRRHDELCEDERGEMFSGEVAAGAIVPTVDARNRRDMHLSAVAHETLSALRPLAARDADVSSLLDALGRGVVDRDEVLEETGMTITEHNNAWRRLGRLTRELPIQLRDHVLVALA